MKLIRKDTPLGISFENDRVLILFGNHLSSFEQLKKTYSNLKLIRVKQTHSDQLALVDLETLDFEISADSLWTQTKNLGLLIATADCMPIAVFSNSQDAVLNIHAGWRGIENQIALKSLSKLQDEGIILSDLQIIVGPHIIQTSFEVDFDVKERLCNSVPQSQKTQSTNEALYRVVGEKFKVDLYAILKLQLVSLGIKESQIINLNIDTKTNLEYHSFRRDREKAGRQLTLIYQKF